MILIFLKFHPNQNHQLKTKLNLSNLLPQFLLIHPLKKTKPN
ncbi:hypothetical protein BVRB_6g135200 [Beta vulgaris subsp. vulgaris]|nr:hypothetical protein BVRB_6g135200 [Beta vulgaris subsp. vulgaris]